MALLYATETAGYGSTPVIKPATPAVGGRLRRYRASITLAAQANADWILLARIPTGALFAFGILTSSVSLATSVIAIGTSPTHGTNGQYRASAVFTAVDTPTLFGLASAMASSALTGDTLIYLTSATAALPGAGTLVVDLYYVQP
jgi:hypothetical protein